MKPTDAPKRKVGRPADPLKGIGCECGSGTEVTDSNLSADRETLRRRRKCKNCGARFTTLEVRVEEGQGSTVLEKMAKRLLATQLRHLADQIDEGHTLGIEKRKGVT